LEWSGKFVFLSVHSVLPPSQKTFEEARGMVVSAFGNEMERRWMDELRRKYPVTVNKSNWLILKDKYAK
jgi:peptidyl-prolyl cis-trans isomerase SurA